MPNAYKGTVYHKKTKKEIIFWLRNNKPQIKTLNSEKKQKKKHYSEYENYTPGNPEFSSEMIQLKEST
jgi:hypothetical protein